MSFLSQAKLGRQKKLERAHPSHLVDREFPLESSGDNMHAINPHMHRKLELLMHLKWRST